MKHPPTSLLVRVLVVLASVMVCGPLGNASSASLEIPRAVRAPDLVTSPDGKGADLSLSSLLTGTVVITTSQGAAATSTKSATPTTAAATATKSSTATLTQPSASNSNTPPSQSPTRTATCTGTPTATLVRTPTPLVTRTLMISMTPAVTVTAVVIRTPTITPTATLTPTGTITPTRTLTPTATLTATTTLTRSVQITTALGAEIDIDPALGGELNIGNGAFVIQMPAGVFSNTHRLVFERLKPTRDQAGGPQLLVAAFSLHAFDRKTTKETTQFAKPVTLRVRYDPKQIKGWRERDLTLAYWDDKRKQWMPIASKVDTKGHTVTAQTAHFTDYGLINSPDIQSYLPDLRSAEPNLFLGAATASYDIQVPPGRNGLAPKLSLSYSSSAVDMMSIFRQASFVGIGWSLSTSYIARDIRSTPDGTDDVFTLVLNGAGYDLVKDGSGYYHTAQEQYWQISYDAANFKWLVITNDGTQYQFGSAPNSRGVEYLHDPDPNHVYYAIWSYWLDKVVDTHGNEIVYSYKHDTETAVCPNGVGYPYDNALYPEIIQYNKSGQSYLTRIELAYSTRNDYWWGSSSYQCAAPVGRSKLASIDVKTTDNANTMQLVRRYEFDYDYSLFEGFYYSATHSNGTLTLKTIRQKGIDGSTPLPPYTLSYNGNRLWYADNGIGGKVSYGFLGPYYFNDVGRGAQTSPLQAGPGVTLYPCDGATCITGNGYAYIDVYNGMPGVQYSFVPEILDGIPGYKIYDGRSELPGGWGFILPHNALYLQIRLYTDGYLKVGNFSVGTLDTYYRIGSRTIDDAQGNAATTTYAYDGPAVNGVNPYCGPTTGQRIYYWSQFRGHSKVTVTDPTGAKTENYFKQDDVLFGKVWKIEQKDANGTLFTRTENTYGQQLIVQAVNSGDNPATCDLSYFTWLSETVRSTFDGQPTPKSVRTAYAMDSYGNVTQTDEYSETGAFFRRTKQVFDANTTKWIVTKPISTQVLAGGTSPVSRSLYFYENDYGGCQNRPQKCDLTRVDVYVNDTQSFTQVRYEYDEYGNQTKQWDALNHAAKTTVYDSVYHIFPETITDASGHQTVNVYDYRLGQPTSTRDPNNATTSYAYDTFGRKTAVWAADTARADIACNRKVRVQPWQPALDRACLCAQRSWWSERHSSVPRGVVVLRRAGACPSAANASGRLDRRRRHGLRSPGTSQEQDESIQPIVLRASHRLRVPWVRAVGQRRRRGYPAHAYTDTALFGRGLCRSESGTRQNPTRL